MESNASEESSAINALLLEYLNWAGLEDTSETFSSECQTRGLHIADELDSRSVSRASTAQPAEDLTEDLLSFFDSGQGSKFFQIWQDLRSVQKQTALEVLTLEFYLHIYFATLPLRHGHKQDHPEAMKVFRQFLESCPRTVGAVQELLPYYALPYVPDPTTHPAFKQIFQNDWSQDLRSRLCSWLGRRSVVQLPAMFSYLRRYRQHANSVGATLLAQESAATAVRSQRTLRRKLQRLNDDYQKLIGVSSELTQALEVAVRGERVDLEATLAACTHRYPELFSLCLTADTSAGPASILLESMQRCERRPGASTHLSALDFERVRADLGTAPDTHVLLLMQALRHRVTRVTTGTVRNAVVTSYIRGDVLGVRSGSRSWSRISGSLTYPHHQLLAQTAARLINALTAFNAGRSYLASEEVIGVLLAALKVESPDPAATDMALAALQKLSIRDEVQSWLIRDGCVEWLAETLSKARTLPPYTQEYAAALLMNLTLRTAGRERCIPLAHSLLSSLTQLLATVPSHVIPYVTGALYSLLSHPTLRQEAFNLGLDSTLKRLSQGGSKEQRRQLEYIVGELQRDPALSPPPSPDPMLDLEEDPEWLEEELDADDPVKAPPHAPTGEDLLSWRYTLHAGDDNRTNENGNRAGEAGRQPRSAPAAAMPWPSLPPLSAPRPSTDGVVTSKQQRKSLNPPSLNASISHWEYPQESEEGLDQKDLYSSRSSNMGDGFMPAGTAWVKREDDPSGDEGRREGGGGGGGGGNESDIWVRGDEVTQDWAMTLRSGSGSRTPRFRSTRGRALAVSPSPSNLESHRESFRRETSPYPTKKRLDDGRTNSSNDGDYGRRRSPSSSVSPSNGKRQQPPPRTAAVERRKISLDDHDALVMASSVVTSKQNLEEDNHTKQVEEPKLYPDVATEEEEEVVNSLDHASPPPPPPPPQERVGDDNQEEEEVAARRNWSGQMGTETEESATEEPLPVVESQSPPPEATQSLCDRKENAEGGTNSRMRRRSMDKVGGLPPPDQQQNPPTSQCSMYDVVASKLLEQIVGESREVPSASSIPTDDDPLLRSLPQPKVSEYKVAFSSRPRLQRTPPSSAAGGQSEEEDGRGFRRRMRRRQSYDPSRGEAPAVEESPPSSSTPSSPLRGQVLPPISTNNHIYTKSTLA